jgi:hypothetical protein
METNQPAPITKEEAFFALEEIDRIGRQMRRTIAAGSMAPMLILWGVIWILGFAAEQFIPRAFRLWLVLDLVGIAASFLLGACSRKSPVKGASPGRIGLSWLILFGYAVLWSFLLQSGRAHYGPFLERKVALLWVTVCMFAYVVMGLWLDRFLLWLGAMITVAALVGFFFVPNYFFLWIAVAGGGSLVVSGVFIRKFWK